MNVYDLQLWQKYFHGASLSGMENYIFCTESVFRETIFNIKDQNKIQNFIAISLVNVFPPLNLASTAHPHYQKLLNATFQTVSNDELSKLLAKIADLEKDIEKLRAENEILQKVKFQVRDL